MVGGRRAAALATALGLVLLGAGPARGACRTQTRVDPAHAFVGQPVAWTVEILRTLDVEKVDWLEEPRFPSVRAVWLPGRVDPQPVTRGGVAWRHSEERRTLFAARPGTLRLPEARLTCDDEPVAVSGATLEVSPLPDGAPPGFAGLVGAVRVITRLEPERIGLGETARLWVVLKGRGNLWEAPSPLDVAKLADVDVFAERPATELDTRDELVVTRTFRYQLVPRREGTFELPPLRVAWFDPSRRAYRIARGPARTLRVSGTATLSSREAPRE